MDIGEEARVCHRRPAIFVEQGEELLDGRESPPLAKAGSFIFGFKQRQQGRCAHAPFPLLPLAAQTAREPIMVDSPLPTQALGEVAGGQRHAGWKPEQPQE